MKTDDMLAAACGEIVREMWNAGPCGFPQGGLAAYFQTHIALLIMSNGEA